MNDRDFVISHLHMDGDNNRVLTHDEDWEIYCIADGFGNLSPSELSEINGGFDWSHIRDSSESAFRNMADRIRQIISK